MVDWSVGLLVCWLVAWLAGLLVVVVVGGGGCDVVVVVVGGGGGVGVGGDGDGELPGQDGGVPQSEHGTGFLQVAPDQALTNCFLKQKHSVVKKLGSQKREE